MALLECNFRVYVYVYMYTSVCASWCGDQRSVSGFIPQVPFTLYFYETESLMSLELIEKVRPDGQGVLEYPPVSTRSGIGTISRCAWLYTWTQGLKLWY